MKRSEWMVGFGYKQAWLAVRDADTDTDTDAVMKALKLRDLGTVPWRSGIDLAYLTDDRVVLTPPIPDADGVRWTLVVGQWLIRADVDVVALSEALATEVQAFVTHRVVELHRWERAVDGELIRAFAYIGEAGEVTRWTGEPDAAERAVGLPATLISAGADADAADVLVGEADVMRVAGAWSVDPTALDGKPAPGPLRIAAAA